MNNKEVLPRERKRHTVHPVSSTPSAVLSREGYPSLTRGYPIPGYPLSWPDWGVPIPGWGYPREGTLDQSLGYPPGKDMGPVEVSWDGDGVPPEKTCEQWKYYGIEMGYLPRCGQTNKLKLLPSPILRMQAVKIKASSRSRHFTSENKSEKDKRNTKLTKCSFWNHAES